MQCRTRFRWFAVVLTVTIAQAGDLPAQDSPAANPRPAPAAAKPGDDVDFDKAREIFRRRQQGEKLTQAEEAYLDRARAARARMNNPPGGAPGAPGRRPGGLAPRDSVGLKPLSDMAAEDRYQGEDGGLYGHGSNVPPDEHRRAAEAELKRITPLDADGRPSDGGTIAFISISMSNATQEFSRFQRLAADDARKSPRLTIVDCAQGGQAMAEWVSPDAQAWRETDRRLSAAGVSPKQVQVAWIKLANKSPSGTLQDHGRKLQRDTQTVIHNAKTRFPNLRIVYLSSRIYGGYAASNLNPEPYAYESAFAVRWLIQDQIAGKAELNFDAAKGEVKSPLLLWGPYFWADGTTPRKSDKLTYVRDDLAGDGTHPSAAGRDKVAGLMLEFLQSDPLAKSWYLGGSR